MRTEGTFLGAGQRQQQRDFNQVSNAVWQGQGQKGGAGRDGTSNSACATVQGAGGQDLYAKLKQCLHHPGLC